MRIIELLEGIQNKFQADLNGLLMIIKGSNMDSIPTATLVRKLNDMGYSVTKNNIVTILKDNPLIKSADSSQIIISLDLDGQSDDTSMDSEVENNELSDSDVDKMTVNDMAKKGMKQ